MENANKRQKTDLTEITEKLEWANECLEEGDQKSLWQVGKAMKALTEKHEENCAVQLADAYFCWGSALARLCVMNDDSTLASAAADKFNTLVKDYYKDNLSLLGSTGIVLWANVLSVVARIEDDLIACDKVLSLYSSASISSSKSSSSSDVFELKFSYSTTLYDLAKYISKEHATDDKSDWPDYKSLVTQATSICSELYQNFKDVEEKEDDEDEEDSVQSEDLSELSLLHANLLALSDDKNDKKEIEQLFERSVTLDENNYPAIVALAQYRPSLKVLGLIKSALMSLGIENVENCGNDVINEDDDADLDSITRLLNAGAEVQLFLNHLKDAQTWAEECHKLNPSLGSAATVARKFALEKDSDACKHWVELHEAYADDHDELLKDSVFDFFKKTL